MNDDENMPQFEIDFSGMEGRLAKTIAEGLLNIEKSQTAKEKVESLTESKKVYEDKPFDYKVGVAKWLTGNLDSRRSLNEELLKVDSFEQAFIKKYDPDRKLTEYKLKESATLNETIGSINPDCCIPEVWADDVERTHIYPGSVFWGAWFVRWERGIEGQPGDKVWICTVGTAMPTTIAAACDEPTTTGASVDCKYITMTDYACAFYMCKNDIESVQPDLITELNAGLGSCLERQIDNYFFDVARTNACTAGTLLSGVPLSGSLIAEAMGSMRNGNQCKWKDLNNSTHINIPIIVVLICVDSENQHKPHVLNVAILEKQNQLKDKLNVPNADIISYLTTRDLENINANGTKQTLRNIKLEWRDIVKNLPNYIINSGQIRETYVIYVENHIKEWNSTKRIIDPTPLTQFGLEIIQKILFYYVNHVMKEPIGQSSDLDGTTRILKTKYSPILLTGTYEPVVLITHPVPMSSLLQDTNFVYACRYGNRDVITGGRVLEWLNLQIYFVPKGTLSVGSGSYDSLLLAKNALAGAIKHGLRIESEYVVRQQRRYVLATIKFGGTCLHPDGIWWIRSKDD